MSASVFFLIPLLTYNLKEFLNNFTKLPPLPMCQKVFSMQMSSAVGIKIKMNQKSYRKRGIQQTSEEDEGRLLL
jgi:hypothetical protein